MSALERLREQVYPSGIIIPGWKVEPVVDVREKARELWETQLAEYFSRFGYKFSDFTFHIPPKPHDGSQFKYYIDGDRVDNGDTAVYVARAPKGAISSWHYHTDGTEYYFLTEGAAELNGTVLPLRQVVEVPTWIIHNVVASDESLLLLRTTGIRGVQSEQIHTKLDAQRAREMGLQGKNALELIQQGVNLPLLASQ